jgi:hypothetical protein
LLKLKKRNEKSIGPAKVEIQKKIRKHSGDK